MNFADDTQLVCRSSGMAGRTIVWVVMVALMSCALPGVAQDLFFGKLDSIPAELETAYTKGLAYLVKLQASDGGWSDSRYGGEQNRAGITGVAVLAMLAHGDDPNSGPYGDAIHRGLAYILKKQDAGNGYIGDSMYNHGFATLALAEAYGAVDEARLGPALEKAVALILTSQEKNPEHAWRYSPESPDADTTVSGACFVALVAARNAGLQVPETAFKKALGYYRRTALEGGGFGYTGKDGSSGPRNAIGVLVFALARQKEEEAYKAGLRALAGSGNEREDNSYPYYYEYYMSQALFQSNVKRWAEWNAVNVKRLAAAQSGNGALDGQLGSAFSTAAGLLSMALNYRYLPIYER